MFRRSLRTWLLLAFPFAAAVGACSEDLDTGSSCPLLCPGQNLVIIDTVIEPAYVFDTTLVGYPSQGLESTLLLSSRPDTVDVRAVIRFDTLTRFYLPPGGDTLEVITHVDSAFLTFRIWNGGIPTPPTFIIDAFDVFDSTVVDSIPTDLLPRFEPSRLIGSFRSDTSFVDSSRIRVPIDSAYLRALIADPARRLHVGLQIRGAASVQMKIAPYFPNGDGPAIAYSISPDTTIPRVQGLQPFSSTPTSPAFVAGDFVDFSIIAQAPSVLAPETFSVGGLPGARAYVRFDLPLWLTDSVGLLRAQLELVQDPVSGLSATDTVRLLTHLVLAGSTVTDLTRAATLLAPAGVLTNTLAIVQGDSGIRRLEMNGLVRQWGSVGGTRRIPSAIVFRTDTEGSSPAALRFFSAAATDSTLRPRLRISYTPSKTFGRP
jgi:hypothetical protein